MADEEWVVIDLVAGMLQAEIFRGLLEAQEIQVWLNQEGAAEAYSLGVGVLGTVEILVPSSQAEQGMAILEEYYAGTLEQEDDFPEIPADSEGEG